MRRPFLPITAAVAAAGLAAAGLGLAAGGGGGASTTKLSATLGARAEKPAPKGAAAATGRFTATLSGSSLAWRLTFSKLTGKAVAAHVHLGKPGVAGPVEVPLCGPCASGAHGTAKLNAKTKAAVLSGRAYVNVHTPKNMAGEIRGQLVRAGGGPAPAPTTTSATTTEDGGGGYGGGYG